MVIEHLSQRLAEVALELNPDGDALQCRIDSVHPQQEGREGREGQEGREDQEDREDQEGQEG